MATDSPLSLFLKRYHIDKWSFFFTVLLGASAIIAVDLLDMPKLVAVVACVSLMVAYGFVTFFLPGLRLQRDQTADNCYYLGLLFTLTSLLMALLHFTSTSEASDYILRNFGIALATTIAGLALRVLLSQFREDPEDLELEAKQALAETVRKLRTELDQAVSELQHFADGARQALDETTSSLILNVRNTSTEFTASIGSATTTLSEHVHSFSAQASSIDETLRAVATTMDGLASSIGAIRVDPDLVERSLTPAITQIETRIGGLDSRIDQERQRLERSVVILANLADAFGRFEGSTDALSRASAQLSAGVGSLTEGASIMTRLETATSSATEEISRLGRDFGTLADEAGRRAEAALGRIEQSSLALSKKTGESLSEVDRSAALAIATLHRLNEELSGSGDTVARVRRELAEIAHWIIERLDQRA